jgi:hypothetical protein
MARTLYPWAPEPCYRANACGAVWDHRDEGGRDGRRTLRAHPAKGVLVTYVPETIDTSHVTLDSDLEELIERLAQNNHDHWSRKRMEQGWRYGEMRDDRDKRHPDLVPYDQLPESEKEYDRKTVREAIKAIIALGYAVRKVR